MPEEEVQTEAEKAAEAIEETFYDAVAKYGVQVLKPGLTIELDGEKLRIDGKVTLILNREEQGILAEAIDYQQLAFADRDAAYELLPDEDPE
jgi:hypothetical protein